MRTIKVLSLLLLWAAIYLSTPSTVAASEGPRKRVSFDVGWRFILGDVAGAEARNFDDRRWRPVDVPHDWSITGTYDADNPSGTAGAFLPTGIGWYRKTFRLADVAEGEKYFIEFDGVYINSDVWINGHHVGHRPNGYIGFSYELTTYLRQGDNVVAVRVDHSKAPSGRWYTGSGIYRHTWLTRTSTTYIPQWGTAVTTPKVGCELALVALAVDIRNERGKTENLLVKSTVRDEDGRVVAVASRKVAVNDSLRLEQRFEIREPKLWSPERPAMYSVKTVLITGGRKVDSYITPFGIRDIVLRSGEGLLLNGVPTKIKGVCMHHDAGPVGSAVPEGVLYRRLLLLKNMGCNAIRTSHNPFAPEFYAMCDTMGFMVMDEVFDGWWDTKAKHDYGLYFAKWWHRDLRDFIRRDRNHPSVVFWSLGNEVHGFGADEQERLVHYVKKLDDTRPITQGEGYRGGHLDIAGFNGQGEMKGALEAYHNAHPNKLVVGTEITHTLQTRGEYRTKTWYRTRDDPAPWEKPGSFNKIKDRITRIPDLSSTEIFAHSSSRYQSSYDNAIIRIGVRDDWNRVEKYPWYVGNFRWTAFDYLGESFGWPARTENFGVIDLAGFPKDHYYLYQSLWTDEPMVHVLPHWTHPGKEGRRIPVVVYTNCPSAELFVNGRSLGIQEIDDERQLLWQVPYEAGELTVVALDDGEVKAQKSYRTAGKPAAIRIDVDRQVVRANRRDVTHCEVTITDGKGNMVPNASNLVTFDIEGPMKIIGVENGDILDTSNHQVNRRKAFNGKCLLILQAMDKQGKVRIKVHSEGLRNASLFLRVE